MLLTLGVFAFFCHTLVLANTVFYAYHLCVYEPAVAVCLLIAIKLCVLKSL
jgi:hypothetical protein